MDSTPADTTYISHTHTHTHTHHTHTQTHTHTRDTPHGKTNEVVYRKGWREYRFS